MPSAPRGRAASTWASWGGVTRVALYDLNVPFIEIPPTQLKKFVTGKGTAKKEHMLMEVLDRWHEKFFDHNICDAFSLVQLGAPSPTRKKETCWLTRRRRSPTW